MKISRMLSVINLLLENDKITANEIAERLEVSKRTIYRDIEALNMAGIPIISYPGLGGGIGIMEGYTIEKNIFSTKDIKNLLAGLAAIHSIDKDLEIKSLMSKVSPENKNIDSEITIDLSSWFSESKFQNIINDFRFSILNHRAVELEYHKKSIYSKRLVQPHKLLFKATSWYLYAYCLERKEFRLFKLLRISSYKILDETFIPKEINEINLNTDFDESYFKATESQELQEVILEYKTKDKEFLIDKVGIQNFKSDKEIIFETSNLDWVADLVIGLQDKVKVIKPKPLIIEIKKRIEKISNLYKS